MTSDYGIVAIITLSFRCTIEGRKRFQKKVCILKHEYEVPFSFEYIPYYYGPFSENLASSLDNLVGLGYVLEERTEYSGLLQYTYRLTSSGEEFAKNQLHSEPYIRFYLRQLIN